jgi:tetratricopeptide (TPR) repeat protein
LIKDAARLQLTPVQLGGLWAQMASDYQDLGEFGESERAYNRALGLLEKEPSAQKAYAVTLSNLGSLYTMTLRFDAAESCQRRSLAVLETLGDPLMLARAQGHLADMYLASGKNKEAAQYATLAVHGVETLPGATNDDKGSVLIAYAYASCLTQHCGEGLEAAREAMRIVSATYAAESFPAGQTHLVLGFAESKTGAIEAADEDLREGLRILRLRLPASHPLVLHALDLYRAYLKDNHRDREAKKIAEEQKKASEQNENCSRCTVSVYGLRGH